MMGIRDMADRVFPGLDPVATVGLCWGLLIMALIVVTCVVGVVLV